MIIKEEMSPRIFNSDVSNEILLGHIRKLSVKEIEEFGRMEHGRIEAQIDEIQSKRLFAEQSLARVMDEEKETYQNQIQELDVAKAACEARAVKLTEGLTLIKGALPHIDLAEMDGTRKNLNDQPQERASDTLTQAKTYSVVKLPLPDDPSATASPVPLWFVL